MMAQLARVQSFGVSQDGVGAGENQSTDQPFGDGVDPADLHGWRFGTASWPGRADSGGNRGLDDYLMHDYDRNIGAEIMGRNKFGPVRGPWPDHEWQGWWGEDPPFHTPVFVLTHHERPSLTLGDTTFHFIDASPAEALAEARAAADGKDVRIGGGVSTVREFLDADLIDTMHVAVSPITFGKGLRLWNSPQDLEDRFFIDTLPSLSGVTHHLLWRR